MRLLAEQIPRSIRAPNKRLKMILDLKMKLSFRLEDDNTHTVVIDVSGSPSMEEAEDLALWLRHVLLEQSEALSREGAAMEARH